MVVPTSRPCTGPRSCGPRTLIWTSFAPSFWRSAARAYERSWPGVWTKVWPWARTRTCACSEVHDQGNAPVQDIGLAHEPPEPPGHVRDITERESFGPVVGPVRNIEREPAPALHLGTAQASTACPGSGSGRDLATGKIIVLDLRVQVPTHDLARTLGAGTLRDLPDTSAGYIPCKVQVRVKDRDLGTRTPSGTVSFYRCSCSSPEHTGSRSGNHKDLALHDHAQGPAHDLVKRPGPVLMLDQERAGPLTGGQDPARILILPCADPIEQGLGLVRGRGFGKSPAHGPDHSPGLHQAVP